MSSVDNEEYKQRIDEKNIHNHVLRENSLQNIPKPNYFVKNVNPFVL
jgi:hypothetical protein